ncbi:MAG: hypothetical protein U1F76_10800 [Candidatus Competibacteraceae bacterium]
MFASDHPRGSNSGGFRPRLPGPSGLLALLLLAGQAIGAEDSLRQLEAEAKRLATTPITTQATPGSSLLDANARLPSGLAQGSFERALQDQFLSIYVLYQRLSPDDKAKVFAGYQQDTRIGTIRDFTLKLLSATP